MVTLSPASATARDSVLSTHLPYSRELEAIERRDLWHYHVVANARGRSCERDGLVVGTIAWDVLHPIPGGVVFSTISASRDRFGAYHTRPRR